MEKVLRLNNSPKEVLEYFQGFREEVMKKAVKALPKELQDIHKGYMEDIEEILKFMSDKFVEKYDGRPIAFFNPNSKES